MYKKILSILSAMTILTLLSGCQLAVADDDAQSGKDTLCGVFVTLKPIEPVPTDTVIELPPNWNGDLSDVLFNEEDSRIYATRHEEENGSVDYTFDGIVGFRMFSITEKNAQGSEKFQATIGDRQWMDVASFYNSTDNGSDIKLTGTLCFDVHFPCHIYTNPVYQTADGRVYCTYGDAHFIEDSDKQAGEWGSTSISTTKTETINNKETSQKLEAIVKLVGSNTNKEIILKQMNSEDEVIEQTVITKNDIPESVRLLPDTAYMILEEHSVDVKDKAAVSRTLLKTDAEFFGASFTGENGIIESYPVTLMH